MHFYCLTIGYVTAENYSIFYKQMIENLEACVNEKPIKSYRIKC